MHRVDLLSRCALRCAFVIGVGDWRRTTKIAGGKRGTTNLPRKTNMTYVLDWCMVDCDISGL